jgi:hypothetical protein
MYIAVHRRNKRLRILLVLGHAAVALSAVALLWLAFSRLDQTVRARQMDPLRRKPVAPGPSEQLALGDAAKVRERGMPQPHSADSGSVISI